MRRKLKFYLSLTMMAITISLGTIGFALIEGISLWKALYLTVVTVSTVGYGDIHAESTTGQGLAMLVIVLGVGAFLGVIANGTEAILDQREGRTRYDKRNMVIGVFMNDVGVRLLSMFHFYELEVAVDPTTLCVTPDWTERDYSTALRGLSKRDCVVSMKESDLAQLKLFLSQKRETLMRLLENPVFLEHEAFSDLLQAVVHLSDELMARDKLEGLPESDLNHLADDAKRVYLLLLRHWLLYLQHLQRHYPYLFSFAVRTNPFQENVSVVVQAAAEKGI
jgi:voltage-gated potassium channel